MRHPYRFLSAVLVLATGALWTTAALAQWQWTDDTGRQIYSDKPPPPSIPENKIIHGADGRPYVPAAKLSKMREDKAPTYGFIEAKPAGAAASAAKPSASAAAGKKPVEKSAKELEQEKKAKAEQAAKEAQAKQAEQEKMAQNCQLLKNNLAAVNSGQRISTLDAKGNRVVMDDAKLNAERQRVQGLMQDNKCN